MSVCLGRTNTTLNIKGVQSGTETSIVGLYEEPSCVHRVNRLDSIEFSSGIPEKQFCLLQNGKHKHRKPQYSDPWQSKH